MRILYTGDFRWEEPVFRDLSFLRRFHPPTTPLSNLYVDTTFCADETLPAFPSRLEVARRILAEVSKWLDEDPIKDPNGFDSASRLVHFNAKLRCGHEKLFALLVDRLGMKVHIEEDRLSDYGNLDQITSMFTIDAASTRLHACRYDMNQSTNSCFASSSSRVLTITASTQWWIRGGGGAGAGRVGATSSSSSDVFMERTSPNCLRFLYSVHPSPEELHLLLTTLKPTRGTPTRRTRTRTPTGKVSFNPRVDLLSKRTEI